MVPKIRHSPVEVGSFILLFTGFCTRILQEVSGSVEAACGLGLADVPNPACWKRIDFLCGDAYRCLKVMLLNVSVCFNRCEVRKV